MIYSVDIHAQVVSVELSTRLTLSKFMLNEYTELMVHTVPSPWFCFVLFCLFTTYIIYLLIGCPV